MLADTPTKAPAVTAIDIPDAEQFNFNPGWLAQDAEPWFQAWPKLRQAIWTSWTEQQVLDPAGYPFRLLPIVLTQSVGTSVITVIDSATVADNGGELQQLLSTGDRALLAKYPSVVMHEGCSFWIPMGFVPIICGVSQPVLNQKSVVNLTERVVGVQRHSMAIGITPLFDVAAAKAASADVRRHVAAFVVRAWPFLPPTWKDSMEAWAKALQ